MLSDCPTSLNPNQLEQFKRDGYLAFENALSAEEVDACRGRLAALVDTICAAPNTRRTAHAVIDTNTRCMVQFEPGVDMDSLDATSRDLKVRKLMSYCNADAYLDAATRSHARIAPIVEAILGADPIRFQDMALVKPPRIGSIKPWHQDNAYFAVVPLDQVLGVWIALDDATIENGCMHVIRGGHRDGARCHYHDRDCEILPDRVDADAAVPIELKAGGVLFFYGMLPHQTPPNRSDQRRRAMQWHYRGAHTHEIAQDEYDTIFAEADGTPASCAAAGR